MKSTLLVQSTRPSKARSPYAVQLERVAGGAYEALSSDGATWYRLTRTEDGWQCSCAGFGYRGQCCHSLAAALPRCYFCLSTEQVHVYRNHYEGGAPIELCARCAGH